MPIPRYGVWKGTPTEWDGTAKPDHGHLTFTDNSGASLDAAVNVMSQSADSRLVYWLLRDFDQTHPLARRLSQLDPGFHAQPSHSPEGLGLDFLRGNFLDVNQGILLSHNAPAQKSDILEYLDPILSRAVDTKTDIYLFGQKYSNNGGSGSGSGQDGIHDIHMNQGNSGRWARDNGIYQDGGIIMGPFADDGHWEGIFLAFAVQTYQTDDRGQPIGDTFAVLLDNLAPAPPTDGGGDDDGGEVDDGSTAVAVQAALVNPVGPDAQPTAGPGETVYLLNRSTQPVDATGWYIENGSGQKQVLPGKFKLAAQSKTGILVPDAPLTNKGGKIVLKDAKGRVVHSVRYSREQAQREGVLVYFSQKKQLSGVV
ncbi:hypothetical protein QBC46DRAFT_320532 [Diplogelasinospora grovesii]|uniref:LTD domain-containing protein n=1 Tax=Diplogelasinospora grovesii TaxID=303347 RepID=A0AAN6N0K5_9PEZI|nr:hypothetical protein QBC46DRAFT_320532 [Diplogelasinospora grovesii]